MRSHCFALFASALTLLGGALAGCATDAPPVDAGRDAADTSVTLDAPLDAPFDAPLDGAAPKDATSRDDALPDVPASEVLATDVAPVDAAEMNPLGLTPGVATTVTLGAFAQPSNFASTIAAADIDYNVPLATWRYAVRLPARFDPTDATRRYGLITYIDAGDVHEVPRTYAAALDAHDLIWIGGQNIGNAQRVSQRIGVALRGAQRMTELYRIDPMRVYTAGLSGGGRTASNLALLRQDVFQGFVGRVGASFPAAIPGWQTAGTAAGTVDMDYEVMGSVTAVPLGLPVHFRTVIMSQYGDFRRAELTAIYRYGHLNQGNTVRAVLRPGGHADEVGDSFTDALTFLDHPAYDVIWDRFEDGRLDANADPARTVAGRGAIVRSGMISEERVTYAGASLGVLRLRGAGAAVEMRDTFTWRHPEGVILDARLRAETATGANQQVGLHIVPEGSAPAATQPGLHLYWGYGQPHRIELVGVDGVRRVLATWAFAGAHPMNMAARVTSPQAGEGMVAEKTFWDSTRSPDAAGASLRFRGEDVRVVLNAVGFQLTFNRPASALTTPHPMGVSLVTVG